MNTLPSEILELIYSLLDSPDKACFRICCKENLSLLPKYEITFNEAIKSGILSLVKFINPEKNPLLLKHVAANGHFEIVRWLMDEKCPFDEFACEAAALGGHLDVLRLLSSRSCPWTHDICDTAAINGHLNVLQWLKEHSAFWDGETSMAAAQGGHLEVLQWLIREGCPWDWGTCAVAANMHHFEILEWLDSVDCPCGRSKH